MKNSFRYLALISLTALLFGFTSTNKENSTASAVASGGGLKNEVITTNFSDANSTDTLSNTFGKDESFIQLNTMPIAIRGGYVLEPGFYEMNCRSYCINAGTYAPSEGDGYLYAPLKGKASETMIALINSAREHPEIPQTSIQSLLWAILSKAKFMDLPPHLKGVAAILLTPKQILELNGGAVGLVSERLLNNMMRTLPFGVRAVINAERNVRSIIYNANTSFEQLERAALLSGSAEITRPDITRGMWSIHPDGYYIRYFTAGYSRTKVQVYVPKDITKSEGEGHGSSNPTSSNSTTVIFNPEGHVAVPANSGAQRLLITNDDIRFPWQLPDNKPCRWKPLVKTMDTKITKFYFKDCKAYKEFIQSSDFQGSTDYSLDFEYTDIQVVKKRGTWTASAERKGKESIKIKMNTPSFKNICEEDCKAVNEFLDDLYTHEEGHAKIAKEVFEEFKEIPSTLTFESTIGKEDAEKGLRAKEEEIIEEFQEILDKRNEEYDKVTNHGWTQEAGPFPEGNNLVLPNCGCPDK